MKKIIEFLKDFFKVNWKFLIFLVGIYLLFTIQLPYVIYTPGGAINLSDRIEVQGGYESKGRLEMAYVSMVKASIPMTLASLVMPNWDLTPKSEITNENESIQDMVQRDRVYMQESIDNATISAYTLTGKGISIKNQINHVIFIDKRADTDLQIGDDIRTVNGQVINTLDDLRALISSGKVGTRYKVTVLRNGRERECYVISFLLDDETRIGVSMVTTYEYNTDPKLSINSRSSESGPSGGLMLSLGIYNALVPNDITNGRTIIGTGTISREGIVGEIGGVKFKLIGAVRNGADIFLCPLENLDEALQVKELNNFDIKVIGVGTLQEAIKELEN